ncbi:hypothetical protein AN901_203287 [Pseudomonas syringae pv. theae]|uniref:Uncharacterized protein n=1 Tax=Pseudomonas syringae pv. theae TaxID=103985 RepID=A0A0N8TKQ8_PSESX|nr:hypothetical protein AN901_203287 [Pseudomonas syringae pv. theae]RMT64025.1 hypothetical protein ALP44_03289 [Pseudomonas syringae pv. theae]
MVKTLASRGRQPQAFISYAAMRSEGEQKRNSAAQRLAQVCNKCA